MDLKKDTAVGPDQNRQPTRECLRTPGRLLVLAVCVVVSALSGKGKALADIHGACANCGVTYLLSKTGFGFARNHVGLCGRCKSPDNFEADPEPPATDENENSEPPKDVAEDVQDLLDDIDGGEPFDISPKGANPDRDENTSADPQPTQGVENSIEDIVNDLDTMLENLNPGNASHPPNHQGDNSPRNEDTRPIDSSEQAKEDANRIKQTLDVLNGGSKPQPPSKTGDNSPRQRDTNEK